MLQGLELLLFALHVHAQLADLSDTRDTWTPEQSWIMHDHGGVGKQNITEA